MQDAIELFVSSLTEAQLDRLFRAYHRKCYDHLMLEPVVPLTPQQERDALRTYLSHFTTHPGADEERRETLSDIVADKDYDRLKTTLCGDQYFQEPLYHMANQRTEHPDLHAVVQRIEGRQPIIG